MKTYINKKAQLLFLVACFLPALLLAQDLNPTLKNLITKGLSKSHSVNINSLGAEQAKIDQRLAKAVFVPRVTFNSSFTRLNDDITFDENTQNLLIGTQKLLIKEAIGLPFNVPLPETVPLTEVPNLQDKNILRSSVAVDWVLFSGFKAKNALKASKHKEASLNYLGGAEKDKIALSIIENYDKLALVYASEKVLTTTENYLKEQIKYVTKAIKNGLATPISRKKIELAQQQLASKKLEFNHNSILLLEMLHQLTGESRESLKILQPKLESFSTNVIINNEKRNEIKALEEAEKATLSKSKMEKSNFIPKVAIKGHYEFLEDGLSLLDPKWFAAIGLRWNVFDGFESKLKSKKSLIESQKYREQIKEAEEMIALNIIKTELDYKSSLQKTTIVEKEIDLANTTYNMVNKQYKNSLASINDVLDAVTDLEKANFKLQESLFNQRRAITALLHAKGVLRSYYN